jgi:hypothetical protein
MLVQYYHPYNVSVFAIFEDGSTGPTSYWNFPVVSTPPIVPQDISSLYRIPPNFKVTYSAATQVFLICRVENSVCGGI